MMLKQLVVVLSIIQFSQCLSIRSNIWWSRRNENSSLDCDIDLNYENPSLEAKICGYCFAKCQQQLGACLLAHIKDVSGDSMNRCQEQSKKCEDRCLNDKRTSRIAEANWAKVVQILSRFNTLSSIEEHERQ